LQPRATKPPLRNEIAPLSLLNKGFLEEDKGGMRTGTYFASLRGAAGSENGCVPPFVELRREEVRFDADGASTKKVFLQKVPREKILNTPESPSKKWEASSKQRERGHAQN